MTVVESAPNVSPRRRTLTIEGQWTLDSFYSLWTGVPVAKVEIVKGQSTKQEGEGAEMNEKAKQATDRAKAAADQIIERAKAQSAELIQRSKVKEAELREKAQKQAADLREKASAAGGRSPPEGQAGCGRAAREGEAGGGGTAREGQGGGGRVCRAKAKKDAEEHMTKVTSKVG